MVYVALSKLYVVHSMYDGINNSYYLSMSFYIPNSARHYLYPHLPPHMNPTLHRLLSHIHPSKAEGMHLLLYAP